MAIERAPAGFVGSLSIDEPSGRTVARKVTSRRCAEVSDALVLSTALAVDPAPALASSSPPSAAATSAPVKASATAAATSPDAPAAATKKARSREQSQPVERSLPSQTLAGSPWSYWLSLGPNARTAVSPQLALGGSLSFEARRRLGATFGTDLTFLREASETVNGAHSAFQFFWVRPYACITIVQVSTALSIGPCVGAELGLLRAGGSELPRPDTQQRPWAAIDLALRASATIGSHFTLDLDAGAALPFTRYQFVFLSPDTPIYDVPIIGATFGASIGWRAF